MLAEVPPPPPSLRPLHPIFLHPPSYSSTAPLALICFMLSARLQ